MSDLSKVGTGAWIHAHRTYAQQENPHYRIQPHELANWIPPALMDDPLFQPMHNSVLCRPPFLFRTPPVTPLARLRSSRLIPRSIDGEPDGNWWDPQQALSRGSTPQALNDYVSQEFFGGREVKEVPAKYMKVPVMPMKPIQKWDLTPASRAKLTKDVLSSPNRLRSSQSLRGISRESLQYHNYQGDSAWKMEKERKEYGSVEDLRPWEDFQGRIMPKRGRPQL